MAALEKKPGPDIGSAPKRPRGRPSGLGYDPSTGEEDRGPGYHGIGEAEFDVFELVDDRSYNPARFYTKSINKHDHSELFQVKVPKGIDSQIHAAVKMVGQYRSPQDFFRDAAIHRLEWLQHHYELDDSVRRLIELERLMADSELAKIETEAMVSAVEQLEEALERYYSSGDIQMFADEIMRGEERVDWLRDPYKAKAAGILLKWKAVGDVQLKKLRERDDRE